MDLGSTVENVAKAAAQKIYARPQQIGKATVVYYTKDEAEILIKESIHLELRKLGLMK